MLPGQPGPKDINFIPVPAAVAHKLPTGEQHIEIISELHDTALPLPHT